MMVGVWAVSVILRDASIVDVFWGLGFALIGCVCLALARGHLPRRIMVAILVSLWGCRLSAYIFWRNRGKGEDYRYRAMRKRFGKHFPIVSLITVFALQGLLMWIVSFPVQAAASSKNPHRITVLDITGSLVWIIGFLFESVGDYQLAQFKSDPSNSGRVMDRGLWKYTRHPNYFGDALLWWGFFLIAISNPDSWWTIVGPLIMTVLLMKVSGVALLEKSLTKTKPEYRDYVSRTNAFFPWFAKRRPEVK